MEKHTMRVAANKKQPMSAEKRTGTERTTKPVGGVDWMNEKFIGEKLIISYRKKPLTSINVGEPVNGETSTKTLVFMTVRFFNGKDIRGEKSKILFAFSDEELKFERKVDENTLLDIKSRRKAARKEVVSWIEKSLAKKMDNDPWVGQEIRCENLKKILRDKFLDRDLKRRLKKFVLLELLWETACLEHQQ